MVTKPTARAAGSLYGRSGTRILAKDLEARTAFARDSVTTRALTRDL